jgi:hypothetical protein
MRSFESLGLGHMVRDVRQVVLFSRQELSALRAAAKATSSSCSGVARSCTLAWMRQHGFLKKEVRRER